MALNFSTHRSVFPSHLSEDNLVSPMRIANGFLVEAIPEVNGDEFPKRWHSNSEIEDRRGSQDSACVDIHDLLPSDPFGMDISSTFTAITGWLENLEMDYGEYGRDNFGIDDGNYKLLAEMNFIWNNAMMFQEFSRGTGFTNEYDLVIGLGEACDEELSEESCHGAFISASSACDVLSFSNEILNNTGRPNNENRTHEDLGAPHPALSFAIGYLGVQDLLTVGLVCKSLHSTVQNDPLLWKHIHIDQPLNEKITDDVLLELTNRAHGILQCLSLVECPMITDECLKRVLESNPKLTKLSVVGCTRISIEGVVNSLKALKSVRTHGVKRLRIGGLYGVTQDHFDELKCLLDTDKCTQQKIHKPHFYYRGNFYVSCDDDRAIDVEMCPRCQNPRLVYDCPSEGCKRNGQECRACTLCIQRCVQCGRCISDGEYEETFCLEYLCSDCWKQDSNHQFRHDRANNSI